MLVPPDYLVEKSTFSVLTSVLVCEEPCQNIVPLTNVLTKRTPLSQIFSDTSTKLCLLNYDLGLASGVDEWASVTQTSSIVLAKLLHRKAKSAWLVCSSAYGRPQTHPWTTTVNKKVTDNLCQKAVLLQWF